MKKVLIKIIILLLGLVSILFITSFFLASKTHSKNNNSNLNSIQKSLIKKNFLCNYKSSGKTIINSIIALGNVNNESKSRIYIGGYYLGGVDRALYYKDSDSSKWEYDQYFANTNATINRLIVNELVSHTDKDGIKSNLSSTSTLMSGVIYASGFNLKTSVSTNDGQLASFSFSKNDSSIKFPTSIWSDEEEFDSNNNNIKIKNIFYWQVPKWSNNPYDLKSLWFTKSYIYIFTETEISTTKYSHNIYTNYSYTKYNYFDSKLVLCSAIVDSSGTQVMDTMKNTTYLFYQNPYTYVVYLVRNQYLDTNINIVTSEVWTSKSPVFDPDQTELIKFTYPENWKNINIKSMCAVSLTDYDASTQYEDIIFGGELYSNSHNNFLIKEWTNYKAPSDNTDSKRKLSNNNYQDQDTDSVINNVEVISTNAREDQFNMLVTGNNLNSKDFCSRYNLNNTNPSKINWTTTDNIENSGLLYVTFDFLNSKMIFYTNKLFLSSNGDNLATFIFQYEYCIRCNNNFIFVKLSDSKNKINQYTKVLITNQKKVKAIRYIFLPIFLLCITIFFWIYRLSRKRRLK